MSLNLRDLRNFELWLSQIIESAKQERKAIKVLIDGMIYRGEAAYMLRASRGITPYRLRKR